MSFPPSPRSFLCTPGNLTFPGNLVLLQTSLLEEVQAVQAPTGHWVFYGPHRQRILATDPNGHPLHECDWRVLPSGQTTLTRARLRLDWGGWVGLKPGGMVQTTRLNLTSKPDWQRLTSDDLRQMAAAALRVSIEGIRLFYGEEDLRLAPNGIATIQHKKDALYVLRRGTFDAPASETPFMACMGAMHWSAIDFLPVVELFQSLLPGTGSIMFELIRGLYDDQTVTRPHPEPLRYRGIPTYPSEAAYRLFSQFFTPQGPGGTDPFPIFMEETRSHEVLWFPNAAPPVRYVEPERDLSVTIAAAQVLKATQPSDRSGLSYQQPNSTGFAPCAKTVTVERGQLVLRDGPTVQQLECSPAWGPLLNSRTPVLPPPSLTWHAFFEQPVPDVLPGEAFSTAVLYPDDDRDVSDIAAHAFVADYLQDRLEQDRTLQQHLSQASELLIDGFDSAITSCLWLDRPRAHTVLYREQAFAQKQAQALWNQLARQGRLSWIPQYRFTMGSVSALVPGSRRYPLIYSWLPQQAWTPPAISQYVSAVASCLASTGTAFLVGPLSLTSSLSAQGFRTHQCQPVDELESVAMHRTILPKTTLRADLTLFFVTR